MPLEHPQAIDIQDPPRVPPGLGELACAGIGVRVEFVSPAAGRSAGERLDHSLAMDQRLREARTRVLQRRIQAAYRTETHARNVCVSAGLGSLLLWLGLLVPAVPSIGNAVSFSGPLLVTVFCVVGFSVAISLPIAAVSAVLAARWRKHLLRTAAEQHLQVRDPGRDEGLR